MHISKLGASLGAQIDDLDLRQPLSGDQVETVKDALLEHLLLIIPKQQLQPQQFVDFVAHFGTPTEHPVFPHIDNYPAIIAIENHGKQYTVNEHWHSDVMFSQQPPGETVLYGLDIPAIGGDTQFSNQYLAYDALSDGMKEMLGSLRAHHGGAGTAKLAGKSADKVPSSLHPVVRTHPKTGRKALYVCRAFTERFENMSIDESRPLLQWLFQHSARYDFTLRHRWQPGDVVIWDNRCTLHYAIHDHGDAPRLLHRCTVAGETPN